MYATTDEVVSSFQSDRLAELTASSGTTPDDDRITNELVTQSAFMNSYLIGRYQTPITNSAALAVLKPHCINLVLCGLFQDRLLAEQYASIRGDRDTTISWLRKIADGTYSLTGADGYVSVIITDEDAAAFGGSDEQVFNTGIYF